MLITPNLSLPYIDVNEAQREVVHNEAIRGLDALVQLVVLDRDLATPPGAPGEGDRYIVDASATGAWAGHERDIAAWQDGAWRFFAPRLGWIAYVADEGALLAFSGSDWVDALTMLTSLQNMLLLGIGTAADATNPLSAKLNNTLWVAKTIAEGGDGHLRYKLSKESASKTLSLLMQTNFSGRAELGLTGDDDFHVKVSADGSSWLDAIVVDNSTGKVTFTQGLSVPAAPFEALAYSGMQVNGAMEVSQECGTSSVSVTSGVTGFGPDGWQVYWVGSTPAFALQQVSTPTPPAGFQFALQLKATTGDAGFGGTSSHRSMLYQHIEGYRISRCDFGKSTAKPISIGFWVYATVTGTMSVALTNAAANRSYVTNVTINAAATWEFKTVAIPGDTSGSWGTTNGIGARIKFSFGTGSTFRTTANTWSAGNYDGTSSTGNFWASNNNLVAITGVIVLPGLELPTSSNVPLLMRSFDEEYWLCQRYYQKSYEYGTAPGAITNSGIEQLRANGANHVGAFQLLRPMGAGPTVTAYNPNSGSTGSWRDIDAGADKTLTVGFASQKSIRYALTSTVDQNWITGHWTADARL